LFLSELLGLLLEELLKCPFGDPLCHNSSDLLHRSEVDIQTRTGVAERTLGNNFPPLSGEFAKFLEFLGSTLGGWPSLALT